MRTERDLYQMYSWWSRGGGLAFDILPSDRPVSRPRSSGSARAFYDPRGAVPSATVWLASVTDGGIDFRYRGLALAPADSTPKSS